MSPMAKHLTSGAKPLSTMTIGGINVSYDEFLFEDYKSKLDYLSNQFSRMWTRFSFFLSVQIATAGFFGYLLFDTQDRNIEAAWIPIAAGVLVSALWFLVGAQDRALVQGYRDEVKRAAKRIAAICERLRWFKYAYAGSVYEEDPRNFIKREVFSWYWKRTSITALAAIVPLLVLSVWALLGMTYHYWSPCLVE